LRRSRRDSSAIPVACAIQLPAVVQPP
jgi:hypothetical protein